MKAATATGEKDGMLEDGKGSSRIVGYRWPKIEICELSDCGQTANEAILKGIHDQRFSFLGT